ncbi:MAG: HmuY family protein [Saprospiraceae bacterium]|nr:HmuY family protein [Saprospiraceae bacterium]
MISLQHLPSATSGQCRNLAIPVGSGKGWYTYDGPRRWSFAPPQAKILLVRTADNKYAKMEIISYYKDAPAISIYDTGQVFYFQGILSGDGSTVLK